MSQNKFMHLFYDADLRCGHEGLSTLARKSKIRCDQLGAGEYVVFLNTREDKAKIYTGNEIVAYFRPGHKITMDHLEGIPKMFLSGAKTSFFFEMDKGIVTKKAA